MGDRKLEGKDAQDDEAPSAKSVSIIGGYEQIYIILKSEISNSAKAEESTNEVLFRCGNWCYRGMIQFNGIKINTPDLPVLIPALQKQQRALRYYCLANNVPTTSAFWEPLKFFNECREFCGAQVTSDSCDKELKKWSHVFPWIDNDQAATYFELAVDVPPCMDGVAMVCCKSYYRGLILISIFSENNFYFVLQSGEGDQALLDIRFPDVSKHGQGLHIASFPDKSIPFRKITLWHVMEPGEIKSKREPVKLRTSNLSSSNYEQTYVIMKSAWDASSPVLSTHRDVFFRFGSWCYVGRVQLTPTLGLADVPYVIPALRMQQSRLEYFCDTSNVPTNSSFTPVLQYVKNIVPHVESLIVSSEDSLRALITRLSTMGLSDSVESWLEGDSSNSFFEFKCVNDDNTTTLFKEIEIVVSKSYHPSGIITIMIFFQGTVYVTVLEGGGENPLLDSRFPDISGKGRGYQLQSYIDGIDGWPGLRKVSIWQTVAALEQEFKDRVSRLAQAKSDLASVADTDASYSASGGTKLEDSSESSAHSMAKEILVESGPESSPHGQEVSLDSPSLEVWEEKHLSSTPLTQSDSIGITNGNFEIAASKEIAQEEDEGFSLSTVADDKRADSKSSVSISDSRIPMSVSVARPHHVPKMDSSLSSKLKEIQDKMMLEQGDGDLAWDATGKPVGKKKRSKKGKKAAGLSGGDIEDSEFLRREIDNVTMGESSLSSSNFNAEAK